MKEEQAKRRRRSAASSFVDAAEAGDMAGRKRKPRETVLCKECGKEFKWERLDRPKPEFCSKECRRKHRTEHGPAAVRESDRHTCPECGKEFIRRFREDGHLHFCSSGCANAYQKRKYVEADSRTCPQCGKRFWRARRKKDSRRFCSWECAVAYAHSQKEARAKKRAEERTRMMLRICPSCGRTFTASRAAMKYCSAACRRTGSSQRARERRKEAQSMRPTGHQNMV